MARPTTLQLRDGYIAQVQAWINANYPSTFPNDIRPHNDMAVNRASVTTVNMFVVGNDKSDETLGANNSGTQMRRTILAIIVRTWDDQKSTEGEDRIINLTDIIQDAAILNRQDTSGQQRWDNVVFRKPAMTMRYNESYWESLTFIELRDRNRYH